MSFKIKKQDELGFKIWLSHIGYVRKDLPAGGCTFKNRKCKPDYVLITKDLTGNNACRQLYNEYKGHLAAPEFTGRITPALHSP